MSNFGLSALAASPIIIICIILGRSVQKEKEKKQVINCWGVIFRCGNIKQSESDWGEETATC